MTGLVLSPQAEWAIVDDVDTCNQYAKSYVPNKYSSYSSPNGIVQSVVLSYATPTVIVPLSKSHILYHVPGDSLCGINHTKCQPPNPVSCSATSACVLGRMASTLRRQPWSQNQSSRLLLLRCESENRLQGVHANPPAKSLYVPAAQAVHARPAGPVYPRSHMHSSSMVLPSAETVPLGQDVQGAGPGSDLYFPIPHIVHISPLFPGDPASH